MDLGPFSSFLFQRQSGGYGTGHSPSSGRCCPARFLRHKRTSTPCPGLRDEDCLITIGLARFPSLTLVGLSTGGFRLAISTSLAT